MSVKLQSKMIGLDKSEVHTKMEQLVFCAIESIVKYSESEIARFVRENEHLFLSEDKHLMGFTTSVCGSSFVNVLMKVANHLPFEIRSEFMIGAVDALKDSVYFVCKRSDDKGIH